MLLNNVLKYFFTVLFLSLITFTNVIKSQPEIPKSGVYCEYHAFKNDSGYVFYLTYKIENNRLIFEKENDKGKYQAQYRISFEANDSIKQTIKRTDIERIITVNSFEETISDKFYSEGVLQLFLNKGNYKIDPSLSDLNSNEDFNLQPIRFNTDVYDTLTYFKPIVVNENKILCNKDSLYQLTNLDGNIPFTSVQSFLIVPTIDTSVSVLNVNIKNNSSDLKFESKDYYLSKLSIEECNGKVVLNNKGGIVTKNFILKDFSTKLDEGPVIIELTNDSKKISFNNIKVEWFKKPFPLRNTEFALDVMKNIESEKTIDSLKDFKDDSLYHVLKNYWKRYDPTPNTQFNELMEEFYQRVEYAINNYSVLSRQDGAETDRGKVYIVYGMPEKIERTSKDNKVIEIWIYLKLGKQFIFADKSGTGNFQLENQP
jgi:GWxTD domain-containing protein